MTRRVTTRRSTDVHHMPCTVAHVAVHGHGPHVRTLNERHRRPDTRAMHTPWISDPARGTARRPRLCTLYVEKYGWNWLARLTAQDVQFTRGSYTVLGPVRDRRTMAR